MALASDGILENSEDLTEFDIDIALENLLCAEKNLLTSAEKYGYSDLRTEGSAMVERTISATNIGGASKTLLIASIKLGFAILHSRFTAAQCSFAKPLMAENRQQVEIKNSDTEMNNLLILTINFATATLNPRFAMADNDADFPSISKHALLAETIGVAFDNHRITCEDSGSFINNILTKMVHNTTAMLLCAGYTSYNFADIINNLAVEKLPIEVVMKMLLTSMLEKEIGKLNAGNASEQPDTASVNYSVKKNRLDRITEFFAFAVALVDAETLTAQDRFFVSFLIFAIALINDRVATGEAVRDDNLHAMVTNLALAIESFARMLKNCTHEHNLSRLPPPNRDFFVDSLAALDKYHPNWDSYKNEIEDNNEIDRPVIMIPPSFDLLRRFVGPTRDGIDGFYYEEVMKRKGHIAGDEGEIKFYRAMENSKIGGILVCGFKVHHDLLSKFQHYFTLKTELNDSSFQRHLKQNKVLYDKLCKVLKSDDMENLATSEFDFILLHPILGIVLIEAKNLENPLGEDEHGMWKMRNTKAFRQIKKGMQIIKEIVRTMYDSETDDDIFAKNIIFLADVQTEPGKITNFDNEIQILCGRVANFEEELHEFFIKLIAERRRLNRNFFEDQSFRKLISVFVGNRPDIFISPVKCVLNGNHLIDAQRFLPVFASILKKRPKVGSKKHAHAHAQYSSSSIAKQKVDEQMSCDNDSLTGQDVMLTYFKNLDPNVTFGEIDNQNGRTIYFTKEQQSIIRNPAQRLIIAGVPGSGKTLIQMMRVFIAMQDKSRHNIPLLASTAAKHVHVYVEFFHSHKKRFVRHSITESRPQLLSIRPNLERDEPCDIFADEVSPSHLSDFCDSSHTFQILSLVLASFREITHIADELVASKFEIVNMKTHFRGTKRIAEAWQQFYFANVKEAVIMGHNFDGIPSEFHEFEHVGECFSAMQARISRLIEIEGCNLNDVAICFATYGEMIAFTEYAKNEKYKFYLTGVYGKLSAYYGFEKDFLLSIFDDLHKEFVDAFKSVATSESKRELGRNRFLGLCLIVLEMRNFGFCDDVTRQAINNYLLSFGMQLEKLKEENRCQREWISNTVTVLKCLYQLTLSHFDSSSMSYDKVTFLSNLPIFINFANAYLHRRREEAEFFSNLAEYFGSIKVVNSWPKILLPYDIPSMQYPIVIVFTRKRISYQRDSAALQLQNYGDFLCVALSRAQSHVIVFEWRHPCAMNDEDRKCSQIITHFLREESESHLTVELNHFYSL